MSHVYGGLPANPTFTTLTVTGAATFASTVTVSGQLIIPLGSAGAPSLTTAGGLTSGLFFESATNLTWASSGVAKARFGSSGLITDVGGFAVGASVPNPDVYWTRHSAANWRQGDAAANDADGVAQTLRSPSGGAVSAGTTGRAGGAYTITAGDGSAAKAASAANGGVGGTLTLYGGAGGAGDGAGVAGAYGGVLVERTGGKLGFYGTAPVALQTGVAVSAAGVHAALVALGLITA